MAPSKLSADEAAAPALKAGSGGAAPRPGNWRLPSLTVMLFLGLVALPTTVSAIYVLAVASPRYVSEARFIVRSVSARQTIGVPSLLRTLGIGRADDDALMVQGYLRSRDALYELVRTVPVRDMFGRADADVLSHHPPPWRRDSAEALFAYYLSRVSVLADMKTGIATLRVSTFSPDDSAVIARALLRQSENLINRINDRANADAIALAERARRQAEDRVIATQTAITAFRNREFLIDPASQSLQTADLIARLSAELAQARMQLDQTMTAAPGSPGIPSLRNRIRALSEQIGAERARVTGSDDALAGKIVAYERLALDRQFADQALASTMQALEIARQEARRQVIYIETIAAPSRPDEATEPERWRVILTVAVSGFAIHAMLWLVIAGAREHGHA